MSRFILLLPLFLFISCSAYKQKATISTYVDPTFRQGQIQSLAIFSIDNDSLTPGDIQNLNKQVYEGIEKKNPYLGLIHPGKVNRILKKSALEYNWQLFYIDYYRLGRPDARILADLGRALGAMAIQHIQIGDIVQQDGVYNEKTAITSVSVRFSIFDTNRGRLIWEGFSEGMKENELTYEKAPPLIEATEIALEKILVNYPAF